MFLNKIFVFVIAVLLGKLMIAQQTLDLSIQHNGVERTYKLYIPESYEEESEAPLLFCFHGWTQEVTSFMQYTADFRAVADTANFILVYPQGTYFNGSTHWNVGSWTAGSRADDIGFVNQMIDSLLANYNVDASRIYACGFSNGGYFSFELACQLSDRIAAIGSVGGLMSKETQNTCNALHPTPIITIHGNEDETVDYYGTSPVNSLSVADYIAFWLEENNIDEAPIEEEVLDNLNTSDGSTVKKFVYGVGDNCTSIEHYRVRRGGHKWPDLEGDPNKVNCDIDASEKIWQFVSKYDINGLIGCEVTNVEGQMLNEESLQIFPNPVEGYFTIQIGGNQSRIYEIYDLLGNIVQEGVAESNITQVSIDHLNEGIYYLKMNDEVIRLVKV